MSWLIHPELYTPMPKRLTSSNLGGKYLRSFSHGSLSYYVLTFRKNRLWNKEGWGLIY